MSKIDEMLKNEKVEWKKLGDVANCFAGGTPKTNVSSYYDGDIPWIRSGEINFNIIKSSERNITEEGLNKSSAKMIRPNSVVLAMTGATVGRSAVVEFYTSCNQSVAAIENDEKILNYKYLYYYISSNYEKIKRMGQGALTSLNLSIIKNILIPIPSLKTQEKIVNYLDEFTDYSVKIKQELQKELNLRNKQYEYYRDKLLSEEYLNKLINKYDLYKYELKETTLGEVIKLKNGRDWKTLNEGDIPVYGSGGPMNIGVNKFSYDKETVLIPRKGSIDNIFYLNEPFWNVDTIYYTEVNTKLLNVKYFYYFMKNIDLISLSINPTRPSLTQEIINNIKITLPPIEIQAKIAEILDKFQALTQYVSGLLPEEIEEREKQYEYYREKLLTFDTERTRGGTNY